MQRIITFSFFLLTSALTASDTLAYIDPGTAGSVVGGIGAGIGLTFAFFGSLAVAAMIKVKKIWNHGIFGKIVIFSALAILVFLIWFAISFFI